MRVLGLGAGTGSCTSIALDVLNAYGHGSTRHRTEHYHDYTFTDISPAFIEWTEALFSKCPPINYKTLDLMVPAAEQGFEFGAYDPMLASNVTHAPSNTD